jgi:hypothetical protein
MLLPHALVQSEFVITVIDAPCRLIGRLPEVPILVLPQPVMTQLEPAKELSPLVAIPMYPVLALVGMLLKYRVAMSFG